MSKLEKKEIGSLIDKIGKLEKLTKMLKNSEQSENTLYLWSFQNLKSVIIKDKIDSSLLDQTDKRLFEIFKEDLNDFAKNVQNIIELIKLVEHKDTQIQEYEKEHKLNLTMENLFEGIYDKNNRTININNIPMDIEELKQLSKPSEIEKYLTTELFKEKDPTITTEKIKEYIHYTKETLPKLKENKHLEIVGFHLKKKEEDGIRHLEGLIGEIVEENYTNVLTKLRKSKKTSQEEKDLFEQEYRSSGSKATIKETTQNNTVIKVEDGKAEVQQVSGKHKKEADKVEKLRKVLEGSKYFDMVEIHNDSKDSVNIDLFTRLIEQIEQLNINLPNKLTFKARKLGWYNAAGLYIPMLDIVAINVNNPSSVIHELVHMIDIMGGFIDDPEKSQKRNDLVNMFKEKLKKIEQSENINFDDYYHDDKEIIARLGEIAGRIMIDKHNDGKKEYNIGEVYEGQENPIQMVKDRKTYEGRPEYFGFGNNKYFNKFEEELVVRYFEQYFTPSQDIELSKGVDNWEVSNYEGEQTKKRKSLKTVFENQFAKYKKMIANIFKVINEESSSNGKEEYNKVIEEIISNNNTLPEEELIATILKYSYLIGDDNLAKTYHRKTGHKSPTLPEYQKTIDIQCGVVNFLLDYYKDNTDMTFYILKYIRTEQPSIEEANLKFVKKDVISRLNFEEVTNRIRNKTEEQIKINELKTGITEDSIVGLKNNGKRLFDEKFIIENKDEIIDYLMTDVKISEARIQKAAEEGRDTSYNSYYSKKIIKSSNERYSIIENLPEDSLSEEEVLKLVKEYQDFNILTLLPEDLQTIATLKVYAETGSYSNFRYLSDGLKFTLLMEELKEQGNFQTLLYSPSNFEHLPELILENKEILAQIINKIPQVYGYLTEEMKNDIELMSMFSEETKLEFLKRTPVNELKTIISEPLKDDFMVEYIINGGDYSQDLIVTLIENQTLKTEQIGSMFNMLKERNMDSFSRIFLAMAKHNNISNEQISLLRDFGQENASLLYNLLNNNNTNSENLIQVWNKYQSTRKAVSQINLTDGMDKKVITSVLNNPNINKSHFKYIFDNIEGAMGLFFSKEIENSEDFDTEVYLTHLKLMFDNYREFTNDNLSGEYSIENLLINRQEELKKDGKIVKTFNDSIEETVFKELSEEIKELIKPVEEGVVELIEDDKYEQLIKDTTSKIKVSTNKVEKILSLLEKIKEQRFGLNMYISMGGDSSVSEEYKTPNELTEETEYKELFQELLNLEKELRGVLGTEEEIKTKSKEGQLNWEFK